MGVAYAPLASLELGGKVKKLWLAIIPAAALVAAAVAVGGAGLGKSTVSTPSDIIAGLSRSQAPDDKLPKEALQLVSGKIAPDATRKLSAEAGTAYYAAPMDQDKVCLITVPAQTEPSLGCALVQGFEGAGLQYESPDKANKAWLTVTMADSEKDQWRQVNDNFYVSAP